MTTLQLTKLFTNLSDQVVQMQVINGYEGRPFLYGKVQRVDDDEVVFYWLRYSKSDKAVKYFRVKIDVVTNIKIT